MPDSIRDGTGAGYHAKVDARNRIHGNTVQQDEQSEAAKFGRAFNINTGLITLTSANESAVMYLKNNDENTVHIKGFVFGLSASTGGSATEQVQATIVRNPTAGTIISGAVDVDINSNRNFGSANALSVDAYKGAEGNTFTNGDDHIFILLKAFDRQQISFDEILPRGASIGVKLTPPTGNTSMDVYTAFIIHHEDPLTQGEI